MSDMIWANAKTPFDLRDYLRSNRPVETSHSLINTCLVGIKATGKPTRQRGLESTVYL